MFFRQNIFITLFCFGSLCSFSQPQRFLDSLETVAKASGPDSSKAKLLEDLGFYYSRIDPQKGLTFATEAKELASHLHLPHREASALCIVADNQRALAQYAESIDNYQRSIGMFRSLGNSKGIAAVKYNLSLISLKIADYPNALKYSFEALEIYEELEEYRNTAIAMENIANIYYELGELEKCHTYYENALEIYKKHGSSLDRGRCLGNKARVSMDQKRYDEALHLLEQALKINISEENERGALINYTNMGNVYLNQGKLEEAMRFHTKALEMSRDQNSPHHIATGKGNIGSVWLEKYQSESPVSPHYLTRAVHFLEEAVKECKSLDFVAPQIEFSGTLIEAYELQGNYQSAFVLLRQTRRLNDSLNSVESKAKIAQLESKRQIDLKERDLKIEEKRLMIASLEEERSVLFYLLIILLLGIVTALFYVRYRRNQAKHRKVLMEITQVQSHEIRGPVATILGLIDLLKSEAGNRGGVTSEIIRGLEETALKLDQAIRTIVRKSSR